MVYVHAAVELDELRRREKEQDTHPDPKIHAFMKVNAGHALSLVSEFRPTDVICLPVAACCERREPQGSRALG